MIFKFLFLFSFSFLFLGGWGWESGRWQRNPQIEKTGQRDLWRSSFLVPQIGAPNPGQAHCRRRKTGNSQSLHDFPKVKLKALRTPWTSFPLSKIRRFSLGSKGTWDKSATKRRSGGRSASRADDSSPQGRARAKPAVADPQSSELRVAPRGPQARSGLSAAGSRAAAQTARKTGRRRTGALGGRRSRSPYPRAGPGQKPLQQSWPRRCEVPRCGQLREGGGHGAARVPLLPFLPRPCTALRPRTRRSFPAQRAGPGWPARKPPAPGSRASHSPLGRRPPRARAHRDGSQLPSGAVARAGARHGRASRGATGRVGAAAAARGQAAPVSASREQAEWPPGRRTADKPSGRWGQSLQRQVSPKEHRSWL